MIKGERDAHFGSISVRGNAPAWPLIISNLKLMKNLSQTNILILS